MSPSRTRTGRSASTVPRSMTAHARPVLSLLCCCLFFGPQTLVAQAVAQPVTLSLHDQAAGVATIESLAVGQSLFVSASGLAPEIRIDVELRDETGQTIRSIETVSDHRGDVPAALLWARTGVRGCDCQDYDGYPYERFEDAVVLVGQQITVVLWDVDADVAVATDSLEIMDRQEPWIYVANAAECPIQFFGRTETVFVVGDGDFTLPVRIFVVPHQTSWAVGMPLEDIRPGYAEGQWIKQSKTGWIEPFFLGGTVVPGLVDVVVRPGGAEGTRLGPGDDWLVLPHFEAEGGPNSDGGMLIDEWGCGGEPL